MAIVVKIQQKVADGVFSAVGTITGVDSNHKPVSGPAEVLVKQVDGKIHLHLDSQLKPSKIMNREVYLYTELESPSEKSPLKPGMEITFPKTLFTLKK